MAVNRLARYVLNTVTVVSVFLCAATIVLWISTAFCQLSFQRASDDDEWPPIFLSCSPMLPRGHAFVRWQPLPSGEWHPALVRRTLAEAQESQVVQVSLDFGADSRWSCPGLSLGLVHRDGHVFGWNVEFSYWAFASLFGILPAFAAVRVYFKAFVMRRRIAQGLCPACGYDVRATRDRCPECGSASATTVALHQRTRAGNAEADPL